ncbi:MAG: hypothetical protein COA85_03875 [Robiginitomaculum sp.]|nr:MAG: hypothetical protein COA85_03875 [Robiginitomaculum sp.]
MAISISLLNKLSMPDLPRVNPHVLGTGILGSVLLLGLLRVLVFGDASAGQVNYVLAIPPVGQTASLAENLRAENSHGETPEPIIQIAGHEPRLPGVDDPGVGHNAHGIKKPAAITLASSSHGPAPDAALVEPGPGGMLPMIAADGRRPADVYARPFKLPAKSPAIALIVGGLGLKKSTTLAAINDLPPQVTLSFVPYTRDLQDWINQARAAGHEVMLELPMEPFDYPQNDPGPQTLLATVSAAENTRRLEWLLSRAWGYFAVTNYMGSKFTASESALAPVLRQLRQRGVDFIYDGEARRSSLSNVANTEHLRWTTADRIIDTEPSSTAIDEQLLHLEAIAIQNGTALGAGFSWPITMERLKVWTETVDMKGYVLVPASAVLRARNGNARIERPAEDAAKMVASSGH